MVAQKQLKNKNTSKASKGLIQFLKDIKSEFKRITWASKDNVKKATATVVTFCFIYMVIIASLDYSFNNLYKLIFK
ncbi:protein translocase subunit SecE [Clostridium acetireducens DSM 10703]|jgi:preprotein translocase subunit SecE|uniref:Protein translocase subunit SecE n=1 Tax=Clostridium acetireducens DSM 10703 TaxID=1121290 RepID=A0A1E8F165_9CLOT|nr:preprotein translocase subunit SecE [Clostridium acetireducens]OFI06907.1 protein translocase subunit SecE [Clostridium acetireducens DSM 10703]